MSNYDLKPETLRILETKLSTALKPKNARGFLYWCQMVGNGFMGEGARLIGDLAGTVQTGYSNVVRQLYTLFSSNPENLRSTTRSLTKKRSIGSYSFQLMSDQRRAKINHAATSAWLEMVGVFGGVVTNAAQAFKHVEGPNAFAHTLPGKLNVTGYTLLSTAVVYGQMANTHSRDFMAYNLAYSQLSNDLKKKLHNEYGEEIHNYTYHLLKEEKKDRKVEKIFETLGFGFITGRAITQYDVGFTVLEESQKLGDILFFTGGLIFVVAGGIVLGKNLKLYDNLVDPIVKKFKKNTDDIQEGVQKTFDLNSVDFEKLPQKLIEKMNAYKNALESLALDTHSQDNKKAQNNSGFSYQTS